jgi:hypothetical protein
MLPVVCLVVLAGAGYAAESTQSELREMVRQSLKKLEDSDKKASEYGFLRHTERKEFNSDGRLKMQTRVVVRREFQDGFPVNRVLERDGQPLSEEERKKNEEAIQKRLAELKSETPEQKAKRQEENRRKQKNEKEGEAWLNEFPEAVDYKLIGEETMNGRVALHLEFTPRPGYQPKNFRAKIFTKLRGHVWLDKAESELVKADAEMFDTVNVGFGLLGKVEKGTHFTIQRTRVAPDAWLTEKESFRFAVRVMLVKWMNTEVTTQYSEFRPKQAYAQSTSAQ